MRFWNYVVSRRKENWERDELCQNRWQLVPGWRWERWYGERTQAAVVESPWLYPQTTLCPSCLLMDMGSWRLGVTVLSVRFSVSLDERRKEWMNFIFCQLIFDRNERILPFFSCRTVFTFSFYSLFFLSRSLQSHLWLWGMIDGVSRGLT